MGTIKGGLTEIAASLNHAYSTVITWNKNCFDLPNGVVSEHFVKEATRLLRIFNNKGSMESIALMALHTFIPLVLQKPAAKSKPRDHIKYLKKRLEWWKNGQIKDLIDEGTVIQKNLKGSKQQTTSIMKGFTRLMFQGKVKQALKLIDGNSGVIGVHSLTDSIRADLQEK